MDYSDILIKKTSQGGTSFYTKEQAEKLMRAANKPEKVISEFFRILEETGEVTVIGAKYSLVQST